MRETRVQLLFPWGRTSLAARYYVLHGNEPTGIGDAYPVSPNQKGHAVLLRQAQILVKEA